MLKKKIQMGCFVEPLYFDFDNLRLLYRNAFLEQPVYREVYPNKNLKVASNQFPPPPLGTIIHYDMVEM